MPTVQGSQGLGNLVRTQDPTPFQRTQLSDEAAGLGAIRREAQATEALGQTVQAVSQVGLRAAAKRKDERDSLAVQDAHIQSQAAINEFMNLSENAITKRKQGDAVGATDETRDFTQSVHDRFAEELTPSQRRGYGILFASDAQAAMNQASRHELRQHEAHKAGTLARTRDAELQAIAADPSADRVQRSAVLMEGVLAATVPAAAERQAQLDRFISDGHKTAMDVISKSEGGGPDMALNYLEANKGEVDARDVQDLKESFERSSVDVGAFNISESVLAQDLSLEESIEAAFEAAALDPTARSIAKADKASERIQEMFSIREGGSQKLDREAMEDANSHLAQGNTYESLPNATKLRIEKKGLYQQYLKMESDIRLGVSRGSFQETAFADYDILSNENPDKFLQLDFAALEADGTISKDSHRDLAKMRVDLIEKRAQQEGAGGASFNKDQQAFGQTMAEARVGAVADLLGKPRKTARKIIKDKNNDDVEAYLVRWGSAVRRKQEDLGRKLNDDEIASIGETLNTEFRRQRPSIFGALGFTEAITTGLAQPQILAVVDPDGEERGVTLRPSAMGRIVDVLQEEGVQRPTEAQVQKIAQELFSRGPNGEPPIARFDINLSTDAIKRIIDIEVEKGTLRVEDPEGIEQLQQIGRVQL